MKKQKNAPQILPREEWPYEVPENWVWTRLEHIAEWGSGGTPSRKQPQYYTGTIPWIKTGELNDDRIYDSEEKITQIALNNSSAKIFPPHSVMIAMYGATIGKTAILEIPAASNQACACAIPIDGINYLFLFYYLRSQKDNFIVNAQGGAQPNISQAIIKHYPFPLPPLPEQQRIVARIESLFAKLDTAAEKIRAALDAFPTRKAALLHKAFTGELTKKWRKEHGMGMESWENLPIEKIATVKGGKRIPKGMKLVNENTGHPYLKAGNLKNGTVLDDDLMFVPDEILTYIKNYTVNAGDVYITNVGACIGDCGIIPQRYDGANFTENAVKLTNLKCHNDYLAMYISSNVIQSEIKAKIASATLGKLSILNIKSLRINLPPLPEQKEIVRILDAILAREQTAKETAERLLGTIALTKKSILARAFRGLLGTNNPKEKSAEGLLKNSKEGY